MSLVVLPWRHSGERGKTLLEVRGKSERALCAQRLRRRRRRKKDSKMLEQGFPAAPQRTPHRSR